MGPGGAGHTAVRIRGGGPGGCPLTVLPGKQAQPAAQGGWRGGEEGFDSGIVLEHQAWAIGEAFEETGEALEETSEAFEEASGEFEETSEVFEETGKALEETGEAFTG